MTDPPDPFETELSGLRPRPISVELRRRVAARLEDCRPARPERRRLGRRVIAVASAAACVAAIVIWWGTASREIGRRDEPRPPVDQPRPTAVIEVADARDDGPTLLACRRALARSPEDLDALIARRTLTAASVNPALERIRAFSRSDAELHALLGDD